MMMVPGETQSGDPSTNTGTRIRRTHLQKQWSQTPGLVNWAQRERMQALPPLSLVTRRDRLKRVLYGHV